MQLHHFSSAIFLLAVCALAGCATSRDEEPSHGGNVVSSSGGLNQLTRAEKAAGWRLLFDGKTTAGWRNFKKQTFPEKGWVVVEGTLKHVENAGGGDIITVDQFQNFDLRWEWKIPARANNGIKYFITEERSGPIGHEYQMIDDSTVKDPRTMTASFYDVLAPTVQNASHPPGQWNQSRILVSGRQVEHWLNGKKVLAYELESEPVMEAIANSKFKTVKGFGTNIRGHILLTDHKDEASYRNIKILPLPPR